MLYKVGPKTSYKWSYGAHISGVIIPLRPFIGVITLLITSRGPPGPPCIKRPLTCCFMISNGSLNIIESESVPKMALCLILNLEK